MPPAPRKRAAPRCQYVEAGRKCGRAGTGTPRLCPRHREVVEDAARANAPHAPPGVNLGNAIRDFMDGKRASSSTVAGAVTDLFQMFSGFVKAGTQVPRATGIPPLGPMGPFRPFSPFRPFEDQPPPPPRPPHRNPAGELAAERLRARQVMGFPATGHLTAEILKKRFRELAKKHHPDRPGGSATRMQAVNHANDVLSEAISTG